MQYDTAHMNVINSRKYEISFLVLTSLLLTLVSNLPYYSLFFNPSFDPPGPDWSILKIASNITWYTLQCLFSILLVFVFNYYWKKYFLPKKAPLVITFPLSTIYNLLIAYGLLKASMYFAGLTVGYPFGEHPTYMYYLWKYVYLIPSAVLLSYLLKLIVKKRVVELTNARLIEENLSIQLTTLKDQIKPHFLFNTLNTLSGIIRNEPRDEGLKFVDDLASVYRYILEQSNHDLVELSVELDFAHSYIRLLEKRFHKKFVTEIDIPDKYLTYQIPPLTIQMLIENAMKHNEFSDASPVNIRIYIENKNVVIENNILPKTSDSSGLGIGLQNLSMRYKILTDQEIVINKIQNKFVVRLPLIEKSK
ncbi:MAG: hypothetical protein CVT99_02495 [Bacteroidetes bacterium HGW-Bacteroidetes-16]|nr:MAG: hypothetical protein CVT99_02495 [Bacteroidetes bacterium HGW-Bacteroidetes-16]